MEYLAIEVEKFYNDCKAFENLNIIGLMWLPPVNDNSSIYFDEMKNLSKKLNLKKELSMGMSSDYNTAIDYGATFIRVGSKIFGDRKIKSLFLYFYLSILIRLKIFFFKAMQPAVEL